MISLAVIPIVAVLFYTINYLSIRLQQFGDRLTSSLTVNEQTERRSTLAAIAFVTALATGTVGCIAETALTAPADDGTFNNLFVTMTVAVAMVTMLPWSLRPSHHGFFFTITAIVSLWFV